MTDKDYIIKTVNARIWERAWRHFPETGEKHEKARDVYVQACMDRIVQGLLETHLRGEWW